MTDLSFIRLDGHDWKQDKGIQLFNFSRVQHGYIIMVRSGRNQMELVSQN